MSNSERHPVVFINPAFDDLKNFIRKDPQIVRAVFKKLALLERSAYAGEGLAGELRGYRKLVVGRNHWRIVWRPIVASSGQQIIEISEIWAVGARSKSEVYAEVIARKNSLGDSPNHISMSEAISQLMPELNDAFVTQQVDELPNWLVSQLTEQLGLNLDQVQEMDLDMAMNVWIAWTNREK